MKKALTFSREGRGRENSSHLNPTPKRNTFQSAGALTATFFVALERTPLERLSGEFQSRTEAECALAWLRNRNPNARLIRRLVFFEVVEA